MKDFALIETMRVAESGHVYLLERHLERLSRSARFFSFHCDVSQIRETIAQTVSRNPHAACLRLTLSSGGQCRLQTRPLPGSYVQRLKLATFRVSSTDLFLYHKTTNRGVYERARAACDDRTDAILVNERGEITETGIMNIAVFRAGRWVTPDSACGLLRGVMRDELLARGEIVEGVILATELAEDEPIRCFNALRGVCDARFFHKDSG